ALRIAGPDSHARAVSARTMAQPWSAVAVAVGSSLRRRRVSLFLQVPASAQLRSALGAQVYFDEAPRLRAQYATNPRTYSRSPTALLPFRPVSPPCRARATRSILKRRARTSRGASWSL